MFVGIKDDHKYSMTLMAAVEPRGEVSPALQAIVSVQAATCSEPGSWRV